VSDKIRQRNDGVRKLCGCARRTWAKCAHPWHFNFKWNGEYYRFTLERRIGKLVRDEAGKWQRDRLTLGKPITNKTDAEDERDRLRTAIREGKLQQQLQPVERPVQETLTLAQLMDAYRKQHVAVHRPDTAKNSVSGRYPLLPQWWHCGPPRTLRVHEYGAGRRPITGFARPSSRARPF
jgi:hypothetical protein